MNPSHSTQGQATTSRRILIIDDNRDAATVMALRLRVCGHETRIAFDGLSALEMASAFEPDAILLDLSMPKLDGYQVCQRLRSQVASKHPRIIAVTGWADPSHQTRSKEAGFDGFSIKAVDDDRLIAWLGSSQLGSFGSSFVE